jgi:hypothetical protein
MLAFPLASLSLCPPAQDGANQHHDDADSIFTHVPTENKDHCTVKEKDCCNHEQDYSDQNNLDYLSAG